MKAKAHVSGQGQPGRLCACRWPKRIHGYLRCLESYLVELFTLRNHHEIHWRGPKRNATHGVLLVQGLMHFFLRYFHFCRQEEGFRPEKLWGCDIPLYTFSCPHCASSDELLVPYARRDVASCPRCGHLLTRTWDIGRAPVVRPDSIPGGQLIENLTPQPKRYYSKSEIKLAMEVAGVEPLVRHVGEPGSDKSPHTTSWTGMDAQTLENARVLVERGSPCASDPSPSSV